MSAPPAATTSRGPCLSITIPTSGENTAPPRLPMAAAAEIVARFQPNSSLSG